MESIGELLAQTRCSRKISLEEISRQTKVKIDILEKLEMNDFASMASPMYTKGFIKIYADYLGLDSAALVNAYLKSQGGLRRKGLSVETDAQIRSRRRELQLPLDSVVRVTAALTIAVLLGLGVRHIWAHRKSAAAANPPVAIPVANFDAYYYPKQNPAPQLLEPPK